ncbi:S1C family serine protease [Streptomyces sp. NPDC015171]|uniref:S1C family serine protease n=1 Tax=Streptomyces sp. NPDC015171 TaxID=3364945 RepID=UPI0036F85E15
MNEGNRVPPADGPGGAAGVTPADRVEGAGPGETVEHTGGAAPGAAAADGDFELAKPAPPARTDGEDAVAAGEAAGEPAREAAGEAARATAGAAVRDAAGQAPWEAPAERPRPLHDPDPYSTPPYGEPGPWAPAPPVQHPAAATPAHGTAVPVPTAPPAEAPPPGPGPHGTAPAPAPVAPAPAPVAPAPAPVALATAPASVPPAQVPAQAAGPGPVTQPVDAGARPGGAWGRYDPWAAASPVEQARARGALQQTGAGVPTDEQRDRRAKRSVLAWALVIAVVCSVAGGVAGAYVERAGLGDDVRLPQAGGVPAGRAPDSVAGIAARALPSVVTLHVRGSDEAGTGTGFVLDAQGHILTNNHVVKPAGSGGEISVTFSSGDTVKAEVVGRDSGYDLAVVQVHGVHGLTPLPLGDSDDVRVGDPVVAIGAPFDLANTVTSGIISAKERPITAGGEKSDGSDVSYVDALQTDAPINPGNSGGPLLDSRAHVIGINSAIRSAGSGADSAGGQAGSIGLGFAIPVNQAKRVAEELIDEGRATHPVIGVTLDMGYSGDGARIDAKSANGGPAVTRGGPGERAGLKAGDVITEVGGERVHTGEELIVKIRAHRPGDRLRLAVRRAGTERDVSLVLGASEQN